MAPISQKRRRGEEDIRKPKKKIRVRKQKHYHSSSEDEDDEQPMVSDAPVKRAVEGKQKPKSILKPAKKAILPEQNGAESASESESDEDGGGIDLDETEMNTALNTAPGAEASDANSDAEEEQAEDVAQDAPSTEESDLEDSDSEGSLTSSTPSTSAKAKKKRNDPSAFATSISKILDTKLTTAKRADPVLSRSANAQKANQSLSDQKLDHQVRNQLRTEKRALLEKGRVRDVLGLETLDVETGKVQEEEKRLKKVAQRGVVRLFNAVRAAQVRAEKGEELVRGEGVVGVEQRRERVGEMSKEGFLDLISRGGAEKAAA